MAGRIGQLARVLGRIVPPALLRHAGRPAALFFHGVERQILDARIQNNHHQAALFTAIAQCLKRDFDVRPLAEIGPVLENPRAHARTVFLMSDDGYANTLSLAAPILADLKLPWTLFVSTAHIGTATPNPVLLARLFFLFAPNGVYALPHLHDKVALVDPDSRARAAAEGVDLLRALPAEKAQETLSAMTAAFPPRRLAALLSRFSSERFLDWDGVRALKAQGVEIGAHADTHWPMHAGQSDAWLAQQARGARARIEQEVGPCRFFAYPFGNVGDIGPGAWRAVKDAGYSHAFTTLSGSLAPGGNPFLLPRYGIGPADTHLASLVPLLWAGNPRLRAFQDRLAG